MVTINVKTKERLTQGIKKFQPVLARAKASDVNESDTVTIIADMLSDVFGFDKYSEVTSEFAIKKTFCDLAIKVEDKLCLLIECKAIGLALKDSFVQQAIDYAANSGVDWVVLTNGLFWRVYKVMFTKPIEKDLIYEFDFSALNGKKQADLETLYYLCREAFVKTGKSSLEDLRDQKQVVNKFFLAQMIMSDTIADTVRKQLKKLSPEIKITSEEISEIIKEEILKREVTEGDKPVEAKKQLAKLEKKITGGTKSVKAPAAAPADSE